MMMIQGLLVKQLDCWKLMERNLGSQGKTGSVTRTIKIARPDSIVKDTGRTREGES